MLTPAATLKEPLFVKCTNRSAGLFDTTATDAVAVTSMNEAPLAALVAKVPAPSKNAPPLT